MGHEMIPAYPPITFDINQFNMGYNQGVKDIKDSLLEWAKKEIERLKQGYKEKWLDAKILYGSTLAMENLIDKLNSM